MSLASILLGLSERIGCSSIWTRAARAEFEAAEADEAGLNWALGVLTMSFTNLIERLLLPWSRQKDETPAFSAAAVVGLLVAAPTLYFLLALSIKSAGSQVLIAPLEPYLAASWFRTISPFFILGSLALAAWINLGVMSSLAVSRDQSGPALLLSLRPRLANLAVLALTGGIAALLTWHLLIEAIVGGD
ncbi:MAG: hypothetical protein KGJ79_03995 [Alphaproteobacteria bacterium]|nr:hypothetical protein [Alphaproteobacteria bacterium]MDE2110281.1 hypothetical protein [Alphaproteobacteria bacterium]